MKEISKVGIVPAIFGIHEPLVFGYPIKMFNPFLGFVYIMAPVIGVILTYIVTSLGWVQSLQVPVSLGQPLLEFMGF